MEIPSVTADELRRKIDDGEAFVLVDALAPMVYAHSHLPGAINLPPLDVDPQDVDPQVVARRIPDRSTEVVVYCANRQCQNSHIAAHRLSVLGYTDVAVYPGGKQDWDEAGLTFESATEPAVTA